MLIQGPWRWSEDAETGGGEWHGPPQAVAALDLRPISDQGTRTSSGYGLWWCPDIKRKDIDDGDVLIAKDWEEKPTKKMRDALAVGHAGSKRSPAGEDVLGLILNLLTDSSDRDGEDGLKPVVPDHRGVIKIAFGNRKTHNVKFAGIGGPHGERVRALIEADLDTVPEHKRQQALGYQLLKYKVRDEDWKLIVKDTARQKRIKGPRKPETIITDDFNRSDESPIGSPWSFVINSSGVGIATNRMNSSTAAHAAVTHGTALSGSDQIAHAHSVGAANSCGPFVRGASTSVGTHYWLRPIGISDIRIYKVVAGVLTQLTDSTVASINTVEYKISASGSSLECFIAGVSANSTTDTSISSGLYAGIGMNSSAKNLDDFYAEDIGSAGGIIYTMLEGTPRGIMRGTFARAHR